MGAIIYSTQEYALNESESFNTGSFKKKCLHRNMMAFVQTSREHAVFMTEPLGYNLKICYFSKNEGDLFFFSKMK